VECPLMKVIITFTFCCDNLWKSKFIALEKPGNLREFFYYFVATRSRITYAGIITCTGGGIQYSMCRVELDFLVLLIFLCFGYML